MSKSLSVIPVALALTMLAGPTPAEAQWGQRIGLGYVVNAPNQYMGLSAHWLTDVAGGLGLYVDGKFTHSSIEDRDDFESQWTARHVDDNFGDVFMSTAEEYVSFNAAVLRPITPELMVYAGAGMTERNAYVEYYDLVERRGTFGFYWVEDAEAEARGINVLAGGFFRIGRNVSLQFGVETQPRGATVGASYSLPLGR